MRTLVLSLALGPTLALAVFFAPPGHAENGHYQAMPGRAGNPRASAQPEGRLAANPPPTEPYRSAFFFPLPAPERPEPGQVWDVSLQDNYYVPNLLYVPAGVTVRWTNRGRHHHTTTANWLWESGEMMPGESFSLTFTRPGRYYYSCRLHPRDMRGIIIVF